MKKVLPVLLLPAALMFTACAHHNDATNEVSSAISPSEYYSSYIEHHPDVLAMTGSNPGRNDTSSTTVTSRTRKGTQKIEDYSYELRGPDGSAWVHFVLEQNNGGPWTMTFGRVVDNEVHGSIMSIMEKERREAESALARQLIDNPLVQHYLGGEQIQEITAYLPDPYEDFSRFPKPEETSPIALQIIDEESDLIPADSPELDKVQQKRIFLANVVGPRGSGQLLYGEYIRKNGKYTVSNVGPSTDDNIPKGARTNDGKRWKKIFSVGG